MGKRKRKAQNDDDHFIVMGADGRLCVSGAARSHLTAALAKLRALPPEVTQMLDDFQTTVRALEAAIGAPTALEVSTYYELVASFEDAMALAMATLHDAAPPDDVTPSILATVLLASARAHFFRYFAAAPTDEARARAYLLSAAGTATCLDTSLNSPGRTLVPEEAEYIAGKMQNVANGFGSVATVVAQKAEALATRLTSQPPMTLREYFEQQSDVYQELSTAFMRGLELHQKMTPEQRRLAPVKISDEQWLTQGQQFASAAAACELLVGFFTRRKGSDEGRPRLILN